MSKSGALLMALAGSVVATVATVAAEGDAAAHALANPADLLARLDEEMSTEPGDLRVMEELPEGADLDVQEASDLLDQFGDEELLSLGDIGERILAHKRTLCRALKHVKSRHEACAHCDHPKHSKCVRRGHKCKRAVIRKACYEDKYGKKLCKRVRRWRNCRISKPHPTPTSLPETPTPTPEPKCLPVGHRCGYGFKKDCCPGSECEGLNGKKSYCVATSTPTPTSLPETPTPTPEPKCSKLGDECKCGPKVDRCCKGLKCSEKLKVCMEENGSD